MKKIKTTTRSKNHGFLLRKSITEVMDECTGMKSLDKLEDFFTELFDDIRDKFNEFESKSNSEESTAKVRSYEQKMVAIKKFWTNKLILDTNLNLIGKESDYHKKFKTLSYHTQEITRKISQTNETYINYIYLEWLKLNFRLEQTMNWDEGYSKDKVHGKFRAMIDMNINKFFNKIIDEEPNAFIKSSRREYNKKVELTITKQFLSKILAAVQSTNINIDKHKFSESFGIKYDDTVRTAYNKINKQGNDIVKKFINSFWNYMTDDERIELIASVKKYLESEKPR